MNTSPGSDPQKSTNPLIHQTIPRLAVRRPNAKIAHLPEPARETVNTMLRDGATYCSIIDKLAEQGHRLTRNGLSRWYRGAHQDWLDQQACLQEVRLKLGFANGLIHDNKAEALTEASLRLAVTRMFNFLLAFDPADFKKSVSSNPGLYPRLLNSLCKLTQGALTFHRYRDDHPSNNSDISAEPTEDPPGSTNSHPVPPLPANAQ